MILHGHRRFVWRRSIARSRSKWTASWRMAPYAVPALVRRFRGELREDHHRSLALSSHCRDPVIRFWLLALRWWRLLVIHRHIIMRHDHGPMVCLHILKAWQELSNRQEKHVIMVTLVPKNHNWIRLDESKEVSFRKSPCKHCNTQTPSTEESTPSHVNFQIGSLKEIVNVCQSWDQ